MTNTYITYANLNRCVRFIEYLDSIGANYNYTIKDDEVCFTIKATAEEWYYIKNAKEAFA